MKNPPFTLSAKAISMIADISALTERFAIHFEKNALKLRKVNRIKTIYSSLAIEGNKLSESQVEDILDGKKVVAPLREIQEVKNAIATYDNFAKFNPFSIADLKKAHKLMMSGLVKNAGEFRNGGVGVFNGDQAVHIAPPAERVDTLISNLFDWLKNAEDHLLIRSCVFHYEFEFIHPFADGNGRIGRLWQSLILAKLNPIFQYLPVETMVHDNQHKYYKAINDSSVAADSGIFIDFMLGEILKALKAHKMSAKSGTVNGRVNGTVKSEEILKYIRKHQGANRNEISNALNIPIRTVSRYLKTLSDKIEFRGVPKTGGYFIK